jgi:tripartite-type tricarboxylate transporter receptor subunit TctC
MLANRRSSLAAFIAVALVIVSEISISARVEAQSYPAKTITFVVPNLAGGSSDLIARAIGAKLAETMGRPVVIDNKPGASEMIATEFLARAAPDGYTIAIFSNALAINDTLSPARRYDTLRDLVPVARLAELPMALIVSAAVPATSLPEFVSYAKANAGKLSYGHVGVGVPHYLTMEWFKRAAGIDVLPVPYKSSPPVYTGLLGGEIQVTVAALGGAVQFIESGKVRALAAMSGRRPRAVPNLPTIAEFGYPEFDLVSWMGIFVPSGTPADIVRKLETEILQAANSPDVREQLRRVGLEASPVGTGDFTAHVKRDVANWAKVIKDVGAKAE